MKKITLAFDSFKGSLTSREVAEAFAQGIHSIVPQCEVRTAYIADGGEGTVEALTDTLGGSYVKLQVSDPLGRPIEAKYGLIDNGKTAIIEMASASGLPLLKEEERNPMLTSTYGTGEMMADAMRRGCRKILMGIGGSATNDAGVGMLQALGYTFRDKCGNTLTGGGEILAHIATIDDSLRNPLLDHTQIIVACDVTNPLYGPNGAAYVFAPQKGANSLMVECLDRGLRNYAKVMRQCGYRDITQLPGAGAAGGLGGGLAAMLGADLMRGVEMILNAMQFDTLIANSDWVFTGEGRIDAQTLMGKAPYGVMQRAMKQGIRTIAIAGSVAWSEPLEESEFYAILPIVDSPCQLTHALQRDVAFGNIRRTARQIAALLTHNQ